MSESAPKGVTVTVPNNTSTRTEVHAGANVIQVRDGNLFVNRGLNDTVAVYAPNKWFKAVVSE